MTKSCDINIRVSPEDHAAILAASKSAGLSMSAYIRRTALAGNVDIESLRSDILSLRRDLTKHGSMVHQAMRKGAVPSSILDAYSKAVLAIDDALAGLPS